MHAERQAVRGAMISSVRACDSRASCNSCADARTYREASNWMASLPTPRCIISLRWKPGTRRRKNTATTKISFGLLTRGLARSSGRIPTNWNSTKENGSWFGKGQVMKSRPALAMQPWRDTRWRAKLSVDRQRPHLLSNQSSRDRESRLDVELARDVAPRRLCGQFHSPVGAGAARDRSGRGADLSNAAAALPGNCRFRCDERREVFPWQPCRGRRKRSSG